jgi:hypothetical protein
MIADILIIVTMLGLAAINLGIDFIYASTEEWEFALIAIALLLGLKVFYWRWRVGC